MTEKHETSTSRPLKTSTLVVLAMVGFVVISTLDRSIWQSITIPKEDLPRLTSKDWYQVMRQIGYLPTWLIVSGVIALVARHAQRRDWWMNAAMIAVGAAASGAIAEILKVVVMRHRPGEDGVYRFAWLLENFDKGPGFGMPSSHAAVAFGGAFAVSYLYRGTCWIMMPLAVGCGLSRMLAGAHFASDVYVAAMIGWAVSKLMLGRRERGRRLSTHTVKAVDAND